MFRFRKQSVATVVCGLATLAFAGSEVRAQASVPLYPGGPTYGQYLSNIQAFRLALSSLPPYPLGYNPYAAALAPGTPPYGSYPGLTNPYAGFTGSAGYGSLPNSNGYSGSYGANYYEDPNAGFLRGSAEVINAQGRFAVLQQQAVLVSEQIKAQRIANRRKVFDEYVHLREKTPTPQDERDRTQQQELRRSLNDPPVTEIWSAKALNDLLNELQKQAAKGVMATSLGPNDLLDPDTLQLVNVTSASRGGNIGLLKNGGRLNWPSAVCGAEFKEARERLSGLVQDAVKEAEFNNRVDPGSLKQMKDDLDRLQRQLSRNVGDLSPSDYIEAKRFLSSLGDALRVMGQTDAASYLNRKYAAKGKTVPDLVKYMTDNGLQFAPAVAGDETAYVALHRALAVYARGLQDPDGKKR
jgi:hypothetical protein